MHPDLAGEGRELPARLWRERRRLTDPEPTSVQTRTILLVHTIRTVVGYPIYLPEFDYAGSEGQSCDKLVHRMSTA